MKNFKKIAIITLIISSVSVGMGLFILYSSESSLEDFVSAVENFINMKNTNIKKSDIINIDEEYSYKLGNEKLLHIDSKISNIEIKTSTADEIVFKIKGNINKKHCRDYLDIKKDGNSFEVKILKNANKNVSILNLGKLNIEIIIPENKFKEINYSTVSGDILIEDLNLEKLDIDSISGNVHLDKGKVNELTCSLVSGNLFSTSTTDKINCDSVSGEIEVLNAYKVNIETISGDIIVKSKNIGDKSYLNSLSGNIKLYSSNLNEIDIYLDSLEESINYNNNKISISKFYDFNSFAEDQINTLNIETMSGDIEIFDEN